MAQPLFRPRWSHVTLFLVTSLAVFNVYVLIGIRTPNHRVPSHEMARRRKTNPQLRPGVVLETGLAESIPETSVCSYRTVTFIDSKILKLNHPVSGRDTSVDMECLMNGTLAVFGETFAVLSGAILDPSKTHAIVNDKTTNTSVSALGGEKMEDVWDQPEINEYLHPLPGYFTIPCKRPPILNFDQTDFKSTWANSLRCYSHDNLLINTTINNNAIQDRPTDQRHAKPSPDPDGFHFVRGLTIATVRYEYANFYHTMTDLYNAFLLKLRLAPWDQRVRILFMDAHPQGSLDALWSDLFGNVTRAGRLEGKTKFERLVWGTQGYRSPLNDHHAPSMPYLEEFCHFFMTRHGVINPDVIDSDRHVIDCRRLKVLVIWRHDHVSHPRNRLGHVVRKFSNEEEIVQKVKDTLREITPGSLGGAMDVRGVVLEGMAMRDQLTLVSDCDILIGMHGAGLAHALFLPRTSGLLEILPAYASPDLLHFQAMARWRGIAYVRWHNVERAVEKNNSETYVRGHVVRRLVKAIHKDVCPRVWR